MRRSGNQVRVNVQLIDANTDEHVWATDYDREYVTDVFAIQSDLAQKSPTRCKRSFRRRKIADDAKADRKRRGLPGLRAGT